MGYYKNLQIELWAEAKYHRGSATTDLTPEEAAALLGGEVDAVGLIYCPSPGRPRTDRSMCVKLSDNGPYVYNCQGSVGIAIAHVRERLGVPETPRRDTTPSALKIHGRTRPGARTVVELYLRSRGLTLPVPPCLRFHASLNHKSGGAWPALVAERTGVNGVLTAIHRIWLRPDGSGKAPVGKDQEKMDLGPSAGTAIRLAPVAEELLVGEGIETTLSVMQEMGKPGWAGGGHLKTMQLPDAVRSVVILADGDHAGHNAAKTAAQRWLAEGLDVRIAYAPWGLDFNDVLRGTVK